MRVAAERWMMQAPGAPLARAPFEAVPGAGEVVVQVAGCGVCHTDLGYAGPGAEGWINAVFDAVHARRIARRAVLVP
jgi:Zn-dependent alcohol dehydrogenase